MTIFVGAEYVIANSLIALKRKRDRTSITLSELNDLGVFIQKMAAEKDVDAIFLTSQDQLIYAIFDFSDYFDYNEADKTIHVKSTKKIRDLSDRFVGYLPWNVLSFLVETTDEFAQRIA